MRELSIDERNKFKRLSHQLTLSEKRLHNHPIMHGHWAVLQSLLHSLNLQMQWTLAGPSARLLMAFCSAFYAQETHKSQTGFIGPALQQLQKNFAQLMRLSLQPHEKACSPLLENFTQILFIGMLYLKTHLTKEWSRLFSKREPTGGHLLQELGLTFLLGSHSLEAAFHSISQGLNLTAHSQKRVTAIGLFFLLSLLLLDEQKHADKEHFFAIMQQKIEPTLETVKDALRAAQIEGLLLEEEMLLALHQCQLLHSALSASDEDMLQKVMMESLNMLNLSHLEVQQDLKQLQALCLQLHEMLKQDTRLTAATVIQAA